MLQTHKWRRPKWVKFPRAMLDDARWLRLSPEAKAAWVDILLIASEKENSTLPEPDILYRRLRILGHCRKETFFAALIDELIQCNFLTKISPEFQSYRVSELQSPLLRKASPNGDASVEDVDKIKEKRSGENGRDYQTPSPNPIFREARESFGREAGSVVAKAMKHWGRDAGDVRDAIETVRDFGGDAHDLAHELWEPE